MYELCPYLYSLRICLNNSIVFCFFFVFAHGESDSSHSLCLAVCHVCSTIELFFFPSQGMLGWEGFYLSQLFCACFFVFSCMVKGNKSQPPCSSLPSMYHWTLFFPSQECFIGNNLTCPTLLCLFVCLFVSAHCGRDQVTASLLCAAKHVPFPSPNVVF